MNEREKDDLYRYVLHEVKHEVIEDVRAERDYVHRTVASGLRTASVSIIVMVAAVGFVGWDTVSDVKQSITREVRDYVDKSGSSDYENAIKDLYLSSLLSSSCLYSSSGGWCNGVEVTEPLAHELVDKFIDTGTLNWQAAQIIDVLKSVRFKVWSRGISKRIGDSVFANIDKEVSSMASLGQIPVAFELLAHFRDVRFLRQAKMIINSYLAEGRPPELRDAVRAAAVYIIGSGSSIDEQTIDKLLEEDTGDFFEISFVAAVVSGSNEQEVASKLSEFDETEMSLDNVYSLGRLLEIYALVVDRPRLQSASINLYVLIVERLLDANVAVIPFADTRNGDVRYLGLFVPSATIDEGVLVDMDGPDRISIVFNKIIEDALVNQEEAELGRILRRINTDYYLYSYSPEFNMFQNRRDPVFSAMATLRVSLSLTPNSFINTSDRRVGYEEIRNGQVEVWPKPPDEDESAGSLWVGWTDNRTKTYQEASLSSLEGLKGARVSLRLGMY